MEVKSMSYSGFSVRAKISINSVGGTGKWEFSVT